MINSVTSIESVAVRAGIAGSRRLARSTGQGRSDRSVTSAVRLCARAATIGANGTTRSGRFGHVRLGAVADIHRNAETLDPVLADAHPFGVDAWWALGDLVLFGPRPTEVVRTLAGLAGIS